MRAMLSPCSPSGKAQPMTTSSTCPGSRFGVRLSNSCMALAAISSGRTVASPPRLAFPTGVRTADTITASFMFRSSLSKIGKWLLSNPYSLISQWLSRLQDVPHACLSAFYSKQGQDRLPLEIKNILLTHPLRAGQVTATHHIGEFARNVMVILCNISAFGKHPRADADCSQRVASSCVNRFGGG